MVSRVSPRAIKIEAMKGRDASLPGRVQLTDLRASMSASFEEQLQAAVRRGFALGYRAGVDIATQITVDRFETLFSLKKPSSPEPIA